MSRDAQTTWPSRWQSLLFPQQEWEIEKILLCAFFGSERWWDHVFYFCWSCDPQEGRDRGRLHTDVPAGEDARCAPGWEGVQLPHLLSGQLLFRPHLHKTEHVWNRAGRVRPLAHWKQHVTQQIEPVPNCVLTWHCTVLRILCGQDCYNKDICFTHFFTRRRSCPVWMGLCLPSPFDPLRRASFVCCLPLRAWFRFQVGPEGTFQLMRELGLWPSVIPPEQINKWRLSPSRSDHHHHHPIECWVVDEAHCCDTSRSLWILIGQHSKATSSEQGCKPTLVKWLLYR